MSTAAVVEKVAEIAGRVAASEGLEIVEVEYKGGGNNRVLRIFIDKPGGVSHADCETVSHQVGVILDVEDVIPVHYTLEVSSPGLDRKLLKPADYQRFLGKKARVKLRGSIAGRSHFIGRLAEFEAGRVGLDVEGNGRVHFAPEDVLVARLVVEF
ncbi:MAG TPA: ribosome maturation factor RimP [Bryobacterales bacterium]|nr:ribosome maturation factor RimP [Bryobacterales bacterium]